MKHVSVMTVKKGQFADSPPLLPSFVRLEKIRHLKFAHYFFEKARANVKRIYI